MLWRSEVRTGCGFGRNVRTYSNPGVPGAPHQKLFGSMGTCAQMEVGSREGSEKEWGPESVHSSFQELCLAGELQMGWWVEEDIGPASFPDREARTHTCTNIRDRDRRGT